MAATNNPWIPIADLFSGFVVVMILLFVGATALPRLEEEARRQELAAKLAAQSRPTESAAERESRRRAEAFSQLRAALREEENRGLVTVDISGRTVELKDVSFEQGSACLDAAAARAVRKIAPLVAREMAQDDRLEVHIEGHTDPRPVTKTRAMCGVFADNTQLSALRAANIRELLMESVPLAARGRMPVTGYGPDRLRNRVDQNAAENRRVELRWIWPGEIESSPR